MPGDQVDIDLRKAYGPRQVIRLIDLFRPVGAAVDLQNLIVEILDPEAKAGHADILDDLQLAFGDGSGLALEGDLLGLPQAARPS